MPATKMSAWPDIEEIGSSASKKRGADSRCRPCGRFAQNIADIKKDPASYDPVIVGPPVVTERIESCPDLATRRGAKAVHSVVRVAGR
ncbi:MAG: hypothetical protein WB946_02295 [Halobacteriota archaeon]